MSNKLKELTAQFKAIKPPEVEVAYGFKFTITSQGTLIISDANGPSNIRLDEQQTQAVFDYLKSLGYT